eukprot:scaffold63304_cov52-Phaeocystis_antarctica.AAC.4
MPTRSAESKGGRTMRSEVVAGRRAGGWTGGSAHAARTARGPGCEGWGGPGHARSAPRTCSACP